MLSREHDRHDAVEIRGRVAVVTGAGSGIGRATAVALARRGSGGGRGRRPRRGRWHRHRRPGRGRRREGPLRPGGPDRSHPIGPALRRCRAPFRAAKRGPQQRRNRLRRAWLAQYVTGAAGAGHRHQPDLGHPRYPAGDRASARPRRVHHQHRLRRRSRPIFRRPRLRGVEGRGDSVHPVLRRSSWVDGNSGERRGARRGQHSHPGQNR